MVNQKTTVTMILLDATYKTTKYASPLFFLVVKTKVNFKVCTVIVLQEESVDMITRSHQSTHLLILMKERYHLWK